MDCIVCYDKSEKSTKCNHLFCNKCYEEWFRMSNICPMCRRPEYEDVDMLDVDYIDIDKLEYVIYEYNRLKKKTINEIQMQDTVNYIYAVIEEYYNLSVYSVENAIILAKREYNVDFINGSLEKDSTFIKLIVEMYKM